jgi:hypothetical protein
MSLSLDQRGKMRQESQQRGRIEELFNGTKESFYLKSRGIERRKIFFGTADYEASNSYFSWGTLCSLVRFLYFL